MGAQGALEEAASRLALIWLFLWLVKLLLGLTGHSL